MSVEDDASRVPEYEIDQQLPRRESFDAETRSRLREQHGFVRAYFIANPEPYTQLQRWLNQAHMGESYDAYLARTIYYAIASAVGAVAVGFVLAAQLVSLGVFSTIEAPGLLPTGVATFLDSNAALLGSIILIVSLTTVAMISTISLRFYYPRFVRNRRRRNINVLLPHAIVYMFALSRGGMTAFGVFDELAEAEGSYGEVAREFDAIVRDIELFGNDLYTAIRDARNTTPSDSMEQFFDDMLSVLDSGSDFASFLEQEAESYMDEARQEQDDFLETLSIMSEVFVVAFVAAPLFLIVTLVVVSLLGGETLTLTFVMIYALVPGLMVMYLLFIDIIAEPYSVEAVVIGAQDVEEVALPDAVTEDPSFESYQRKKRWRELLRPIRNPVESLYRGSPFLVLAPAVPLAITYLAVVIGTGVATPTLEAITTTPVRTTTLLFIVPLLTVLGPLTAVYEFQRRRQLNIKRRFPDALNILSSANQMGIRLSEALSLVSRWTDGVFAKELRRVSNDITWNHDIERALLSFGRRLQVPQVSRTIRLIAKGTRSSSDLARVLKIAARDTRNRYQLERQRRRELSAYIAIVVIGFLVYLGVVVIIDVSYLAPLAEVGSEVEGEQARQVFSVGQVPVDTYQMTFFHSALIQGFGSGLLAGKLAEDDVMSGLKYGIGLVLVSLVVFAFV